MDDEGGDLFAIEVSSDEAGIKPSKIPRDFQSEEDFLQTKKEWRAKVEVGELWKSLRLPLDNLSKPEAQAILHSIEELYFFRRYVEALEITETALKGRLTDEFRKTLEKYKKNCEDKVSPMRMYHGQN